MKKHINAGHKRDHKCEYCGRVFSEACIMILTQTYIELFMILSLSLLAFVYFILIRKNKKFSLWNEIYSITKKIGSRWKKI